MFESTSYILGPSYPRCENLEYTTPREPCMNKGLLLCHHDYISSIRWIGHLSHDENLETIMTEYQDSSHVFGRPPVTKSQDDIDTEGVLKEICNQIPLWKRHFASTFSTGESQFLCWILYSSWSEIMQARFYRKQHTIGLHRQRGLYSLVEGCLLHKR